ncbi:Interleukin enhancer-binding factor 2 [Intoshia linei]|uniref:Interleukin enhancer-binding factor 2 n=1 Tax=Intoshia linei TaxID=1819745 RepID=A0A177AVG8_9BILA|nr:Interleukin enhancer-binding factor 2 [Intoshia linei]
MRNRFANRKRFSGRKVLNYTYSPKPKLPKRLDFASRVYSTIPFDLYSISNVLTCRNRDENFIKQANILEECVSNRLAQIEPEKEVADQLTIMVPLVISSFDVLGTKNNDPFVEIEEIKVVGSFKMETMIKTKISADVVIVLGKLPTFETVNDIKNNILMYFKKQDEKYNDMTVDDFDGGLIITFETSIVYIYVSTIPNNYIDLVPEKQVSSLMVSKSLMAIEHCRWFEEYSGHEMTKKIIKIMKDFQNRFTVFQKMNVWFIHQLCHHVVYNAIINDDEADVYTVYLKIFQLLACAVMLPGSPIIYDPVTPSNQILKCNKLSFNDQ